MDKLEAQFKEEMHEICRKSRAIGYSPVRFEQMVSEHSALATAQRLLAASAHHDGLTRLWQCRRLDLSLECVVLKPVFRPLFTEQELDVARCKLRDLKFDPSICEGG